MQVIFDLPRDWEVQTCEINGKTQIVIEPLFRKNQRSANLLLATTIGDSGRKRRTAITVSGTTGTLHAAPINELSAPVAFDKPMEQKQQEEHEATPEVPPVPEAVGVKDGGEIDSVPGAVVEQGSHVVE